MRGKWDKEAFPEGTHVRFLNKWAEYYVYGIVEACNPPLDPIFIPVRITKYTAEYIDGSRNRDIHTGFYAKNLKKIDENQIREVIEI